MYQLGVPQGQGDSSAPSTTDPLICGFCLVTTPNTRGKTVEQSIVTWMFAREFITNRTDRQTENTICRAAWSHSQLKNCGFWQCLKLSQKCCRSSCLELQIINIKLKKNQQKVPGPPPKLSALDRRTCGNFQHCLSYANLMLGTLKNRDTLYLQ